MTECIDVNVFMSNVKKCIRLGLRITATANRWPMDAFKYIDHTYTNCLLLVWLSVCAWIARRVYIVARRYRMSVAYYTQRCVVGCRVWYDDDCRLLTIICVRECLGISKSGIGAIIVHSCFFHFVRLDLACSTFVQTDYTHAQTRMHTHTHIERRTNDIDPLNGFIPSYKEPWIHFVEFHLNHRRVCVRAARASTRKIDLNSRFFFFCCYFSTLLLHYSFIFRHRIFSQSYRDINDSVNFISFHYRQLAFRIVNSVVVQLSTAKDCIVWRIVVK